MSSFKSLPSTPNFPDIEQEMTSWWQKNDLVSKYLHKNDKSENIFSFIDGPITANGPMGVHHARGRTIKDVVQRYKNAQGFAQRFQNGFDCQGLWVEVEVEKENSFNSKKDILTYGLDKFTQNCLDRVKKYATLQTEQSKRLGMFMDWENSYYTNSMTNNLYIWHFLKKIHEKGWLYKKKSATTWCPRCETGLSAHEQADGYKDITDVSVYVKFKIKNKDEYILAWTTTPWTLSSNVLLAINTKYKYVKAKHENEILYLAKNSADKLGITDYEIIDAKKLLDIEYESLYDFPAQNNIKHKVVQWDLVDPVDGTGIVHIAPGCGQEDYELGLSLNSDIVSPLDETGHFIDGFGTLSGKYAHDVLGEVLTYLEDKKLLFKKEKVEHRYPHCWRCKTKCLFRLEDNWFIDCDKIRPQLKKEALKANWIPKYISRRMQNWLDNMEDWMISRKRFYGLALPFYECSCGQLTVIGSKEELKEIAVNPELVDKLKSVHRPYIDEIEIKCPKCGQPVKRITDVGDCWLDAGVVPFSTLKYLEDKKYWQKWFPAEFISEMVEQVRLWYYSVLFFGVVLENEIPYKNVLSYSEVRDEKGERMSKTKHNGIPFDDAVSKMGADAMRWLYCLQKSHISVNFGYSISDQIRKEFFLILWNSFKFFLNYEKINDTPTPTLIDQWLISRTNHTIKKVSNYLDKYNIASATNEISVFVNELSTWYIRRNRDRRDNYQLLNNTFTQLFGLLSPFIPYLSEYLYQFINPNQSIHLQDWPKYNSKLIDMDLEKNMLLIREICSLIHAQRQLANIKVRQPLATATIATSSPFLNEDFENIIKDETNIKKILWQETKETMTVVLDTNLTPKLIAEGEYRDFVRSIQVMRKEQKFDIQDKIQITAPSWPKDFENGILQKTLATSIKVGDTLKITKSND
jgi:isoleucyl-tRNA synthetase